MVYVGLVAAGRCLGLWNGAPSGLRKGVVVIETRLGQALPVKPCRLESQRYGAGSWPRERISGADWGDAPTGKSALLRLPVAVFTLLIVVERQRKGQKPPT